MHAYPPEPFKTRLFRMIYRLSGRKPSVDAFLSNQLRYRRYLPEFAELAASTRSGKPLSVSLGTELMVQETLLRACEML